MTSRFAELLLQTLSETQVENEDEGREEDEDGDECEGIKGKTTKRGHKAVCEFAIYAPRKKGS